MTLIEYEFFRKIEPKECLNQSWNKSNKEEIAPHIVALIDRFNKLSRWTVTTVVKEENIQTRAKLIEKFTHIALVSLLNCLPT